MTRQSQRQDDRGRQVCLAIATTTSEGQHGTARRTQATAGLTSPRRAAVAHA
jgi:hypothetical protein